MRDITSKVFKFSLFLLFIQSMYVWFLWGQIIFVILFTLCCSFFFIISRRRIFSFNYSNLVPVFLLIAIQLYVVRDNSLNAIIAALLRIFILSIIILFKDYIKIDLLNYFTKAFAILLTISLFAWILFLIGVRLPYVFSQFNDGQYLFDNYYFFMINQYAPTHLVIPRFASVFLEPGHLGMISSFLLLVNKFNFKKKEVIVLLIVTILTFSLAAYIILLTTLTLFLIENSNKPIRNFVFWGVFIASMYLLFVNFNNGDNLINNLIIERLKFEDGTIRGNNRFSSDFNDYFKDFIQSPRNMLGLGVLKYSEMTWEAGSAGYKVYLVQHGILGTLLVFLFYLSIVLQNKNRMTWMLFIAYILIFIQASYPLWECEILIFITAIPYLRNEKALKIQKHK